MSLLLHIAIIATYCAAALAVAIMAPARVPVIAPELAPLLGGFVLLMAGFIHFVAVQGARHRVVRHHLTTVREAYDRLAGDVELVYTQSSQLRDAMAATSKRDAKRVSDMVAEVRLLQSLIEKFSHAGGTKPTAKLAAPKPPADRPAEPPPATAENVTVLADVLPMRPPELVRSPRPEMPQVVTDVDERQALSILREGLRLDRVDVYLQPVVSLPQRKTRYYECFTRVRDDQGTVIVPEQYIEVARREGLVTTIDNMLLFRCVQLIRRTQKRNFNTLFFCNISHDSLADAEFFDDFLDFIAENDDLAPMLILEFRQQDVQAADNALLRKLGRLADLGFRFSLDGVTHFNMNYGALAKAQFRFLRLEVGQVLDQLRRSDADIDVRDLKRRLDRDGIDLIVEKIETEDELRELLDVKVDFGQGYLFGEPRLSRDD